MILPYEECHLQTSTGKFCKFSLFFFEKKKKKTEKKWYRRGMQVPRYLATTVCYGHNQEPAAIIVYEPLVALRRNFDEDARRRQLAATLSNFSNEELTQT